MLKAIFNWFTGKPLPGTTAPDVKPEAAPYKVEAPVQSAPAQVPSPVAEIKPEPKKKRTFVKRNEGDAKVAKIKAPAKSKAPKKPKTK